MAEFTPTQKLAGTILGKPVMDWIADQRAAGESWRTIARNLHGQTGGLVDVTPETLRLWDMERAA